MGLTDKLKDIGKQAQGVVAEHRDEIQGAVDKVGAAANERTNGRYADRIAKAGEKLHATVDKVGTNAPDQDGEAPSAGSASAGSPTDSDPAGDPPAFA